MRPEIAKDDVRVDESTCLHVLVGISEGLMQRGAVFIIEPVSWIERQEPEYRVTYLSGRTDSAPDRVKTPKTLARGA